LLSFYGIWYRRDFTLSFQAVRRNTEYSAKAVVAESPFEDQQEIHLIAEIDEGLQIIVPCTSDAGTLACYSP